MSVLLFVLFACWGDNAYIVEGVVVEVRDGRVTLDHDDIPGLMPAMVMEFEVSDPAQLESLRPGHRVLARYMLRDTGGRLERIRVTGHGPPPQVQIPVAPVRPGRAMRPFTATTHEGATITLGEGQARATALTFIYTRCPVPDMCPAMVARLQALQEQLTEQDEVQFVAVTLDPAFDTVPVLAAYADQVGAGPRWKMARVEPAVLADLAMTAAMNVLREGDEIQHAMRLLVLDREGRLVERYDDARFPAGRVLEQLRTGGPAAPPNTSGTATPVP